MKSLFFKRFYFPRITIDKWFFIAALVSQFIFSGNTLAQGKKYALLIGLNEYLAEGEGLTTLNYTDEDVDSLEVILEQDKFLVTKLKNEDAKREDIVEQLNRFAFKVKPDDIFLLYFSGHGIRNKIINEESYWMTFDAHIRALDVNGLRLKHLLDYVQDIKADLKLVLLDHCYSGDIVNSLESVTGSLAGRGGNDSLDITKGSIPIEKIQSEISQPRKGMVVLAAARQEALESAKLGHGLFTYVLLKALNSNSADLDSNSKLSVLELQTYMNKEVPLLARSEYHIEQKMVDFTVGSGLSGVEILDQLPSSQTPISIRRDIYFNCLDQWYKKNWIKIRAKQYCREIITKWHDATLINSPFEGEDKEMFNKITEHTGPAGENILNQSFAESLQSFITVVLQ